jgi:transcriptional regulator with XRE-family HTH domain
MIKMKNINSVKEIINDIEKNDELLSKWRKHYELEEEIIAKMVEVRKIKSISQKELAEKCGLKQSAIARIEKRVNSPQLDTIIRVSDALGLKIEFIDNNQAIFDKNVLNEYNFVFDDLVEQFNSKTDLIQFHIQNQKIEKETIYEDQKHNASSGQNFSA